ncbi:hypothetical protein ACF08M_38895 [Streptomyces sp. NPDC015032]|uniref:hypothetical protein n=1 Tax=Streptomyces sp. NPDC015032 TaxID=3364937 RepID=UPI0036FBBC8C
MFEDMAQLRKDGAYCPPPYYRLTFRTTDGMVVNTSGAIYLAHVPAPGLVLRIGRRHWRVEAAQLNVPEPGQLGGREQTPPECLLRVSPCSSVDT